MRNSIAPSTAMHTGTLKPQTASDIALVDDLAEQIIDRLNLRDAIRDKSPQWLLAKIHLEASELAMQIEKGQWSEYIAGWRTAEIGLALIMLRKALKTKR